MSWETPFQQRKWDDVLSFRWRLFTSTEAISSAGKQSLDPCHSVSMMLTSGEAMPASAAVCYFREGVREQSGVWWNLNVTLNPVSTQREKFFVPWRGRRRAIEFTWNLCIRKNHIKWNLGPCLVSNTSSLPNRNLSWVSVQLKPCLFSTCSNCCLIQMSNLIFLGLLTYHSDEPYWNTQKDF